MNQDIWVKIFNNGDGGQRFFVFIFFISIDFVGLCDAMPFITIIWRVVIIAN